MQEASGQERAEGLNFKVYAREKRRHLKDAELIARTLAGEEVAYEILMGRYVPLVLRYLDSRLHPSTDAEDLAQEVFLAAYTHLKCLRDRNRFGPWVLRIAQNALMDHHRKAARRPTALAPLPGSDEDAALDRVADPAPNPRERTAERQAWQIILEAVDRMSEANRSVLLARLVGEESAGEIAERLGLKTKTVRKRLVRAMCQLRKAMERKGLTSTGQGGGT